MGKLRLQSQTETCARVARARKAPTMPDRHHVYDYTLHDDPTADDADLSGYRVHTTWALSTFWKSPPKMVVFVACDFNFL